MGIIARKAPGAAGPVTIEHPQRFGDDLIELERSRITNAQQHATRIKGAESLREKQGKKEGKWSLPLNPGGEVGFVAGGIGSIYAFQKALEMGLLQKIPNDLQFLVFPAAAIAIGLTSVGLAWVGMKAWDGIMGKNRRG
ncbi:MAG: hypothetical protein NTU61_00765 [Candidatus Altiarchaeota archaeon]|nr:hypothetical protein [Candidatus Altiarchaeota archaeon]